MIHVRYTCVLVTAICLALTGCLSSGRWPRLVEGAQYEVNNPSPCTAQVYTATEDNVTRQYLGDVRSGRRALFTVPPRAEGTRVAAMALYRDGTNCDVESRIRIRRVSR
jgi:hypothetical protein